MTTLQTKSRLFYNVYQGISDRPVAKMSKWSHLILRPVEDSKFPLLSRNSIFVSKFDSVAIFFARKIGALDYNLGRYVISISIYL